MEQDWRKKRRLIKVIPWHMLIIVLCMKKLRPARKDWQLDHPTRQVTGVEIHHGIAANIIGDIPIVGGFQHL